MDRRQLLKILLSGAAGHILDLDRLLWIPNTKKIFLPSVTRLTESQIIAVELQRIIPHIRNLFDRDDTFYSLLNSSRSAERVSKRDLDVPLIVSSEKLYESD